MSDQTKQEGEFSLKGKKTKPKNLGKTESVTKIKIPNTAPEAQGEVVPEVTKVVIKKEDNAIEEQSADEVLVRDQSEVGEGVSEENIETTAPRTRRGSR